MSNLIVVNNPRDWLLAVPGVTVVPARGKKPLPRANAIEGLRSRNRAQQPLFVAKCRMVSGHTRIILHCDERYEFAEGEREALSVGEAPDRAVKTALRAAGLSGDEFYGRDIQQIGNRGCIIEINDEPNEERKRGAVR